MMKKKTIVIWLLIGFIAGLGFSVSATTAKAQPPSYELVCRGGGDMVAQYKAYHRVHRIGINFRKAPRAAGGKNYPDPGKCAWVDRPLNASEPALLTWNTKEGNLFVEFREGRTRKDIQPHYIDNVVTAIERGQVFRVMCYNNGRALVITGRPGRTRGSIDTR